MMGYLYIAGCIVFTVYGQIVLKWRMATKGGLPEAFADKLTFLLQALFGDIFMLSGFAAAFAASLFWMAAMTKFELSFAYPFMSLSFVLVLILSALFFGESLTPSRACGVLIICIGVFVASRID